MENFRVKQWAVENLSNQSEAAYWHFLYFFLDGWTLIDPSNNLRGGFEGSVIFTDSTTNSLRSGCAWVLMINGNAKLKRTFLQFLASPCTLEGWATRAIIIVTSDETLR